jgi:GTPase Era involved in 16S rRNA processing
LDILTNFKQIEINNNLPFEIIDGDLLEMPRALMKKLFAEKNDRAVVISILGPQSSGKSTLLNFLFGCDFATSEGRCTRGVYGTYFKFTERKGHSNCPNNCEGIFVIDTEGLFAVTNDKDRSDDDRKNFDSKLVLFCLAISDFVVLNVRGNVDKNTEKIVKMCHERLIDLNIKEEKRPEIIVVLNQNASKRIEESENEFNEIRKSIKF